jgi:DNA-binding beta-propeller fold protein YncE
MKDKRSLLLAAVSVVSIGVALGVWEARARAAGAGDPQFIPTGVTITPHAAPGSRFDSLNPDVPDDPGFTADHAVSMAVSPDKKTLLVLTSGYNSQNFTTGPNKGAADPALSNEYVFVYNIENDEPIKRQVLTVPNAFEGVAWNPNGLEFYVTGWNPNPAIGGAFVDDDVFVFDFDPITSTWKPNAAATVKLDHLPSDNPTQPSPDCAVYATRCVPGLGVTPAPAGVAVTKDGSRLVVANYENDSISVVDVASHHKIAELDLRPGGGRPGGTFPFWVAIKGSDTAFVSSIRDREIIVVSNLRTHPAIAGRIALKGEPTKLLLNGEQTLLFVVEANRDVVGIVNTRTYHLLEEVNTTAPISTYDPRKFKGSNPTGLTLSPDERRLYVTNGGANSLAVIELRHDGDGDHDEDDEDLSPHARVIGLVPTGWYPEAVATDRDGRFLYVVNGKSNTGPDPQACRDKGSLNPDGSAGSEDNCNAANQYVWQLTKAGFLSLPVPGKDALEQLTGQVARNNHYGRRPKGDEKDLVVFLREHVKHVIYIVKENRTYDQILGDLPVGNGDPSITVYPQAITPNQHALAARFVDLDNFYDSGEVSGDGWNWSTSAQANDTIEKTEPINYAGRGLNYDYEGTNRNINVSFATLAERLAANPITPSDPNVLPGRADVSAPDIDGEKGAGYLWDAAMRSGVSVRNYGFFIDLTRYSLPFPGPGIPLIQQPFLAGVQVSFATNAALRSVTDPYFRGYDNHFPDYWRVQEWAREFDSYEANGNLPNLEFVRVMHDHTGNFAAAIDGLNTPTIQTADNDYAVGLIVQKVSHSPRYKDNTLILVLEDDSQDGPDHVDAHRSVLFAAGAHIKRGTVVSKAYTTVNVIRTIVDVLGIDHFNVNESSAEPMTAIFQKTTKPWAFDAIVPAVLRQSTLPLPAAFARNGSRPGDSFDATATRPHHDATYWDAETREFDFSVEDRADPAAYNQVLWRGIMGDEVPYPAARSGANLRNNRKALLSAYRASLRRRPPAAAAGATDR